MFAGTYTALVTPFRNGGVDYDGFRKLIEAQIAGGVDGIVPVGTTGESPTLSHDEHRDVIKAAVEIAAGRVKVVGGTGSNSTDEAIGLTQDAEKAGADGALIVAPYYNKPSPEGLYRHFRAIAEATKLPIMLYSIPGRCGIEIGLDVLERLVAACPNIRAIKEAGGNPERVSQMRQILPSSFEILSGDDGLTLPFMSVGGVGIVSVASNVIPRQISDMVKLALQGDYTGARVLHEQYYPLFAAFLKLATNPIPVKTAMALAGHCTDELRLPLVPMEAAKVAELKAVLSKLGLI